MDTATALGVAIEGDGFVVGVDESPSALVLPPSARAVHVAPATPRDLARLLEGVAPKIAALGAGITERGASETRNGPTPEGDVSSGAPPRKNLKISLIEGSRTATQIARSVLPGARFSLLGCMQRPPLDGPVDLRGDVGAAPSVMERPPPIANEESDLGGADFAKRRPGVGT
ncbi:MAG: hypothetical protein U0441_35465 [Polyangiaceae bacterium]